MFGDETLFGGVRLDSSNQWVKLAKLIAWEAVEERSADRLGGDTGNPAKSARMAVGALIVKERYGFSDEDTLQEIRMNPYLQYFLGLTGIQHNAPFDLSTLTLFRRRVTPGMPGELNDFISGRKDPYAKKDAEPPEDEGPKDPPTGGTPGETSSVSENHGTLTLDATCVPQDIRFPTDIGLLNDAREALERMIDEAFAVGEKPRAYREKARRDYLNYVRSRKPSRKLSRKSLRRQLGYIARDLGYLEVRLKEIPGVLSEKQLQRLAVIRTLYAQQKVMYSKRENRVADRIVSLHEPWVRPIVRGEVQCAGGVRREARDQPDERLRAGGEVQLGRVPRRTYADRRGRSVSAGLWLLSRADLGGQSVSHPGELSVLQGTRHLHGRTEAGPPTRGQGALPAAAPRGMAGIRRAGGSRMRLRHRQTPLHVGLRDDAP